MKQNKDHGRKALQFTQDDMKRLLAEGINAALQHFTKTQIIEWIEFVPYGEKVWIAGFLVRDRATDTMWGFVTTVPPLKEATDDKP